MQVLPVFAILAGCSGEPSSPPTTDPRSREEILLTRPAPPPGPHARTTIALAEVVGAGAVRCPIAGGDRARVRHGTARDSMLFWGLLLAMEVDPQTDAVWNPVFDSVKVEQDWVTLLVMPGRTRSWVDSGTRTLELDHPSVAAGQTASCTGVREVTTRQLRGTIEGAVPPSAHFVPCFRQAPAVGADGTFVVDVPVPCTGWIEGGGQRSEPLRIDAGEGPLEHTFTLAPETLQLADGTWTTEGLRAAKLTLGRLDRSRQLSTELIDRVKTELGRDRDAVDTLEGWRKALWEQKLQIEAVEKTLAATAPDGRPAPPGR